MSLQRDLSLLAFILLSSALPVAAQTAPVGRAVSSPQAPVNEVGLPALLPVTAESPMDSMYYADRGLPSQTPAGAGPDVARTSGMMFEVTLPPGNGGTGTDKAELFWYQLPVTIPYDPEGTPHPMVIAWHGFGQSAASVHNQSTIDEEADARGWLYVSVTGIDDQLFGSPISQQNAEAAIQYMLDNFNVDPDRLYMVGFSMGGGIVANFASRRRDPVGMRIAAIGSVSGGFDWTLTHNMGQAAIQAVLEGVYNFGGPPSTHAFNYQQASASYYDPASYPPVPGVLQDTLSMATNLHSMPLFLTWDTTDTIVEIPQENVDFVNLIIAQGGEVTTNVVTGTIDPITQLPAPHSWAVLAEPLLFNFFQDKIADRTPAVFDAQIDLDAVASYTTVTQGVPGSFSYVTSSADPGTNTIVLTGVSNVDELTLDLRAASMVKPGPLHVTATSADSSGFRLNLTWFAQPPSYLLDWTAGTLVTGTGSEPLTDTLFVDVAPHSTLDVQLVSEPWLGELYSSPNPAPVPGVVNFTFYGPTGSTTLFLMIGFAEALLPVPGGFTMSIIPTVTLPLPLDSNGDMVLPGAIPNDPALSGTQVLFQGVTIDAAVNVSSISNLWIMDLQ